MRAFYLADFALNPPQGVLGGEPGMAASASVIGADGSERATEPVGDSLLEPGQWIRGVEAGGGGYGDPLDRDPDAVVYDVLEGWVSLEAAEGVYGVVLRPQAGPVGLGVDEEATRLRREELRATETERGAKGS